MMSDSIQEFRDSISGKITLIPFMTKRKIPSLKCNTRLDSKTYAYNLMLKEIETLGLRIHPYTNLRRVAENLDQASQL